MGKRFTDTEIWSDPWYRKLPCEYKNLWRFICDQCNHAGIWKADAETAYFHIGAKIDLDDALKHLNKDKERVVVCKGKWFIRGFIDFQYGELNPANRVHQSVITILKKEGLYKGLTSPIEGCKDKEKDKDKDMDKVKDKDKYRQDIAKAGEAYFNGR